MNSVVKEEKCEVFTVRFSGFEGLPARKGRDKVHSPYFTCFGHRWRVVLFPGGYKTSGDGYVAVYLDNCSPGSVEVQTTFTVAESKTTFAAVYASGAKIFQAVGESNKVGGTSNFAQRSTIIGALKDGALIVTLQMKQTGPSSLPPPPFVPKNPFSTNSLKRFGDEESSDVVFEVSSDKAEEGGRKARKRAKVSPTLFHAHRFVLLDNAPALAEACESSSGLTPIPIAGIKPEIFRRVLYYVYGGEVIDEDKDNPFSPLGDRRYWGAADMDEVSGDDDSGINQALMESAKSFIDAADRFGVASLKLEAEAWYVENADITIDNAIDELLYADAKNCPLLKETVIDFLVENGKDAVKKLSFDDVPGCLMKDLLTSMNRGKEEDTASSESSDLCTMRVSELRRKVDEKGLEVDGSREAMIAALEAYRPPRFAWELPSDEESIVSGLAASVANEGEG